MNIVKNINQYDENSLFFCEPIKNNIIDDSYFIRILYSTHNVVINGVYLLITLNNITCEKYYNKYRCCFNPNNHKDIIDISYDKIMDKVFKIKEREKDTFTDRLKGKSDEARNVDTIMKINKLGEWGKGLQKGLTSYVKENYDEERDMMMNIASIERVVRKNPDVTDENIDQHMDDYVYNKNIDLEAEREAYDMTNQIDDYNDGNFEGDEVENWEEYDS